ncbi:hypothetical protein BH10PSE19_BH10PSE19_20000 [soil metagenome]
MQIAFFTLITFRWLFQALFTPKHSSTEPQDSITALLLLSYVVFLTLAATLGEITITSLVLLSAAVTLRTLAVYQLKDQFSYPCKPTEQFTIVNQGIYSLHKNPLLLGFWMELAIFIGILPLIFVAKVMLALMCGLICAWHAHVDNNYLLLKSEPYVKYWQKTSNIVLNWFLPERAKLLDRKHFCFNMFGLYLFIGSCTAIIFAIGHGLTITLIAITLIMATTGSFIFFYINTTRKKFNMGFSFYGGLITGVLTLLFYSYINNILLFTTLNLATASFAIAHAISHIGHIAEGCCHGSIQKNYRLYDLMNRDPQQSINLLFNKNESITAPTLMIEALALCIIGFLCVFLMPYALVIWLVGYGVLSILMQGVQQESGNISKCILSLVLLIAGILIAEYMWTVNLYTIIPKWSAPSWEVGILAVLIALLFAMVQSLRIKPATVS